MRVRGQTLEVRPDAWSEMLTEQLRESLRKQADSWEAHGVTAPPVAEMLSQLVTLLPPAAPNVLDAEIGPFYDTVTVATLLGGVSKQAVEARRKKHTLLAVKTADGRWAYPTFQFTGDAVDPRLVPAVQAFRSAPAWSAALWFVTPNPDLDDATPLAWARDERPPETLTASARRTTHEWQ